MLFPKGIVLLAAVSGGADSTAMLAALSSIVKKQETFFSLRCLHVEHGIRDPHESRGDADFVVGMCGKLSVPCKVVSIPQGKVALYAQKKGTGIEAAARHFRRKALLHEARLIESETPANARADVLILTAHTMDDMLELALMRILRGSGPEGLAAMPLRRGRFLRPLLGVRRAGVIGYLEAKKIPWREDSTNKDTTLLRNRIRRSLIPLLNDIYPSWTSGVKAMAETQSLAARFIREEQGRITRNGSFDEDSFFALPVIIREEALFSAVNRTAKKRGGTVKRRVLRRFCMGLIKNADLGQAVVARENGKIVVKPVNNSECFERGFSLLIKKPGLYTLKGIAVKALPAPGPDCAETRGFYASLPLVIRRGHKEDFSAAESGKIARYDIAKRHRLIAVDNLGTAAFIGAGGVPLFKREPETKRSAGEIFFCVTGSSEWGCKC
jgi:tRNA(Ile)-lysidine synthase